MKLLLFSFILLYSSVSSALDPKLSLRLGKSDQSLTHIEKQLSKNNIEDVNQLKKFHLKSIEIKEFAQLCISANEQSINNSADDLELLGPQALPEDTEITSKRVSLNQNMLGSAQQLASCRLMLLRVVTTINDSVVQQQGIIESRLFTKKTTALEHLNYHLNNPILLVSEVNNFVLNEIQKSTWANHSVWLLSLSFFALVLTFILKKFLIKHLNKFQYSESLNLTDHIRLSLFSCTNHYLPLFLVSSFLATYLFVVTPSNESNFLNDALMSLSLLVLLVWVIRVLFNPCRPAKLFLEMNKKVSLTLTQRLRVLAGLLCLGYLLFSSIQTQSFDPNVIGIVHNVYLFFLVLNLIWITLIIGQFNWLSNTTLPRILLILALVGALLSDWMGYGNLALFILVGLSASIVIILIGFSLSRLFTDFLDGLDEGRHQWQINLRKKIGVKSEEYIPGGIWLRFSGNIVILAFCLFIILKSWGLSDSSLLEIKGLVLEGFSLGSVKIVPTRVLMSLFSFFLMLSLIGWVKRRLDKSWLNRSRMDRGSKEAMISLTGYFGLAAALLITLSIAGVQLANIAIIAGALSVGIGFGLQNIVNNFVSGVILLFERPIKTGDWIAVGGTEGYVRKISIRSTQIQTFDRSDVMVPNSELISGQVTNWMLRDSRGRLIVPIGVAYGTDPQMVRSILLGIANAHDQVIRNSPILSNPYVLFREFADSSLNFELRCFLINVDSRMEVLSDINFEIDRLFKANNIEIPFPQQDIHIKPELIKSELIKPELKEPE